MITITTGGIMETELLMTLSYKAEKIGSSLMISISYATKKIRQSSHAPPFFSLIWAAFCYSPGDEAPSPNNPGQGVPNAIVAKIQIIKVQVFPVTPYLSKS